MHKKIEEEYSDQEEINREFESEKKLNIRSYK